MNLRNVVLAAVCAMSFHSVVKGQFICTVEESQSGDIEYPDCFLPDTISVYHPGDTLGPLWLRFHVVRLSDGTRGGYKPLNNDSLQQVIDEVRSVFMASHVKIDVRLVLNIHYIDSDIIFRDFREGRMNPYQLAGMYDSAGVVDVYFTLFKPVPTLQQPSSAKGSGAITRTIGEPYGSIFIGTSDYWDDQLTTHGRILVHELGHILGLMHTFEQHFGAERIARVDCDSLGDKICDTPADPGRVLQWEAESCEIDSAASWYLQDPDGARYVDAGALKPDPINFMTYPPIPCMQRFTAQQGAVMRCTMLHWRTDSTFDQYVANRTVANENVGDSILVKLSPKRFGAASYPYVSVPSGSSFVTAPGLAGMTSTQSKLYARDTLRYGSDRLKHYAWKNDLSGSNTRIPLDHAYNAGWTDPQKKSEGEAWFKSVTTKPLIASTVESSAMPSLPFRFYDPWRSTYWTDSMRYRFPNARPRAWSDVLTPFTPVTGAFRDMRYLPQLDLINSYYRVQAPLGMRYPGYTTLFDPSVSACYTGDLLLTGWVSTHANAFDGIAAAPSYEERAVIFRDSSHIITLAYKGHLLSVSDLTSNSQRKLVFDNGSYYFAYNSGGSSWLTKKGSDAGDSWIPERRIEFAKDAPVSIDAQDSRLFTAYALGNYWELRELDPSTLGTVDSVFLPLASSDSASQAVVAKQTAQNTVVTSAALQRAAAKTIGIYALSQQSGGSLALSDSAVVGGLIGAASNPTLVCDVSGAFHLAWEEEGRILYRRFLVDANGHIDSLDATPDEVSDCAGISHGAKPCITVDDGNRPHVVWETAMNEIRAVEWPDLVDHSYGRNIAYRMKRVPSDPASWTNVLLFEIKGKYSYNPVSGNDRMNSGTVRIVWQTNEDGGRVHAAVGEPIAGVPPLWTRLYANWRRKTLPDT